jgi:ATP-binding cassette subfamily C protein CydD
MILIGNLAEGMTKRQWISLSRMSAHFLDVLQGLTTLKILGRSRAQIEIIAFISDRFRLTTMSVLRVAFLSALVLEWVATLSVAVVAVQVGLRLLYGFLEFEQALFVLILAPEFYLPLRLLGTRFHAGMSGAAAAKRIFEVLETPPPIATADGRPSTAETFTDPSSSSQTTPPPHHPTTIRFSDVHYAYDAGQRPALNGVSFTIDPGEKVALVGRSGAGKSTIAHLLLRFIDPTQGTVSAADLPLPKFDPTTWRAQFAWVPQNPYLFHASIADNIRLARPEAELKEVIEAAYQARADNFITALPQGYDTIIGERGARLSGGQAQRVALARAFLKDAPYLILDEATANLDPEIAVQIQAAIERLEHGRSALIIAHRLSTIRTVDKILVLDHGQIVETGRHNSLLRKKGLYRQLVTSYQRAT